MSLDVYLISEMPVLKIGGTGIFMRIDGQNKEVSIEEWNELNPDKMLEEQTANIEETHYVFEYNITHNLGKMADAAGVYRCCWRPEEIGILKAGHLIEPLQKGLAKLKANPEEYKKMNPENGWGSYDGLVKFIEKYLEACEKYPTASIRVSR